MEISAEQFQQIVESAARQRSDRRSEKRGAVRIGVRYGVMVRPIIPQLNLSATPFRAMLRDIPGVGVGLVTPVAMVGRFTLETIDAHGGTFVVNCRVNVCEKIAADQFRVGATFVAEET